jgi:hypothetical protein
MDQSTERPTDQSWFTLTEAADRTGLTVEALRQRIKRRKIRAVKGNDGRLRVHLTVADIEALTSQPVGRSSGQPVDNSSIVKTLQDYITTLRDQLARAETMLDQARAEAGQGRGEAAEAHSMIRGLMDTIVRLHVRLEAAETEARAAVETLERVRARGFWARMLGR